MSKQKKTKSEKHDRVKADNPAAAFAANQDIIGLLTTLVQKLTSFETKLDTVLNRLSSRPPAPAAPRPQLAPNPVHARPREARSMHKAVCADCGRDCEVPFKPSGGRPVYCKECFTVRKHNGTFGQRRENVPPGPVRPTEKPPEIIKPAQPAKKNDRPRKRKKDKHGK